MSVTRSELIKRIAAANGLDDRMAATALAAMVGAIATSLEDGWRVEVRRFGSFRSCERPERMGRHPRTGEPIQILSRRTVHFKAGEGLSALLNGDHDALAALQEKRNQQYRRRDERSGQLSLF